MNKGINKTDILSKPAAVDVLSLFDGMACGMLAFQKAGIKVNNYYAYEIDKYAIKTVLHNFPDTQELGDVFDEDFSKYENIDFLVGGSPCTYWSIAQSPNKRETTASGLGWELFSQYVRAIKEAKPKYFIYENNKSMAKAIYKSISETFGFEPIMINSALVSAQNRQRYYWVGKRNDDGTYGKVDVKQPDDRGILLKDVLDGVVDREKSRAIIASIGRTTTREYFKKNQGQMSCEPVAFSMVGEIVDTSDISPIKVGEVGNGGQGNRIYSVEGKSITQQANSGGLGSNTGLYAIPFEFLDLTIRNNAHIAINDNAIRGVQNKNNASCAENFYEFTDTKANTLTTAHRPKIIDELSNYACFAEACEWNENCEPTKAISFADGKKYAVYTVKYGQITIKEKQYPIKLKDGFYIIRKLTVSECMRLQTIPEWYEFPVSDTQAYKMMGNGWTVDVISHLIESIFQE